MGCEKSSNPILPVELIVYPKGVLTVELQNGYLTRDTSMMLKMDPYAVLTMGGQ